MQNMPRSAPDLNSAAKLAQRYLALLDKDLPEQRYQAFLEANTSLMPREFVQNHGIHFSLVLRKMAFGADYRSDFVYLSKSSDDWNCVLVEIERPTSRFFKNHSNEFHGDLVAAHQQINSWRGWFSEPSNHESFVRNNLGLVRKPLERNPTFMKYVLVMGRRAEYSENEVRRRLIRSLEQPDFKILSFDSLAENLPHKHELYVAARKNSFIDILNDEFLDETIFSWMQPEQIRISAKLKENAIAARSKWQSVTMFDRTADGNLPRTMDHVLSKIRIRN
jgi:hypothetical protein